MANFTNIKISAICREIFDHPENCLPRREFLFGGDCCATCEFDDTVGQGRAWAMVLTCAKSSLAYMNYRVDRWMKRCECPALHPLNMERERAIGGQVARLLTALQSADCGRHHRRLRPLSPKGSMGTTRIETADIEALEHRVREVTRGLITFDGCMLAGKTELMREIARRLGIQGLDLDDFVERQQGVFVEALRLQELTAAIEQASAKFGVVLLSGVCMLEVLRRTGRESSLTVYVQANNQDGTPDDIDLIGAETGRRPDLLEFFGELEDECFSYHARYRPRKGADVLFIRPVEQGKRPAGPRHTSANNRKAHGNGLSRCQVTQEAPWRHR